MKSLIWLKEFAACWRSRFVFLSFHSTISSTDWLLKWRKDKFKEEGEDRAVAPSVHYCYNRKLVSSSGAEFNKLSPPFQSGWASKQQQPIQSMLAHEDKSSIDWRDWLVDCRSPREQSSPRKTKSCLSWLLFHWRWDWVWWFVCLRG